MAHRSRPLVLKLPVQVYGVLLRAFPEAFRRHMGDDMLAAFAQGCRRSLEKDGLVGLAGYATRGFLDVVREGLAERRTIRAGKVKRMDRAPGLSLDRIRQDLGFSFRMIRRKPVYSAVVFLTLALGVGSSTAIFSVVSGVLLKPFPYPDAEQLAVLWNTNSDRDQTEFRMSAPGFFEVERSTSAFSGMALLAGATANFTDADLPPVRVEGALVSAGVFEVLGVRPLMGRTFRAEENRGDHRVVVLSHSLWKGRFGGDPEILGERIEMDGIAVEVVGVMPAVPLPIGGSGIELPGQDTWLFWRPLNYDLDWVSEIGAHVMAVVARMDGPTTLTRAQEQVTATARALAEAGNAPEGQGILVRPLKDQVVGGVRRNLIVLMASVGFLVLMACGNLANLLLARSNDRERELAVRSALGAGRRRLVGQVLTETTLFALGGGLLGLALSWWATSTLIGMLPSSLPRQEEVGIDGWALLFGLATAVAVSFLAALVPAARLADRSVIGGLREGGRGGTPGQGMQRANRFIVVGQVAVATVLLFGAGLLFRSLRTLEGVDPGFRKEGVVTAQLFLPDAGYGERGEVTSFFDQLRERIESLPGVEAVALGMNHPLENTWWNGFTLMDRPSPDPDRSPTAIFRPVSDGFFATAGIPLLEGRAFNPGDRFDGHPVMIVNRAFVDRFFQGESPLGERIEFTVGRHIWGEEAPSVFEVVGVVGDVLFNGLREPSEPAFHIPLGQFPYQAVKLMAQGAGDPESLAATIQDQVWALDPDLPVTEIRTMDQLFSGEVAQDRFNVLLLQSFALAALLLAGAGIFGVLSIHVSQRRAEIGIRMALGARASRILGRVVTEAFLLAGAGLLLGLGLALGLARLLGTLLFQVPPHDPRVVLAVCSVLALIAVGSGLIPAFRAAATDPMDALRAE